MSNEITPFEQIRRTNAAGNEFWSSRDFARVLGYNDYRNFEAVIEKARTACFNSGQRGEDHIVDITEMVGIGSGAQRPLRTVMMSRYACYLVIQNADPAKELVALGQSYFAVQTRRQELSDQEIEAQRRLRIRAELKAHNVQLADMTVPQKLEVIERVWASLCDQDAKVASPTWHREVLASRKKLHAAGKTTFSNWSEAKERIRRKVRAR